jgi:hypothetical protein
MSTDLWDAVARHPGTRCTQWRLRSRACAAADRVAATVAVCTFVLAVVDSVASWPSDRVLIGQGDLDHAAGLALLPSFFWLGVSSWLLFGAGWSPSQPRKPHLTIDRPSLWRAAMPAPAVRACFLMASVACAALVVGGLVVGFDKGEARTLPGPRHEVSSPSLDDGGGWTPVSAAQYQVWQARFVREDAMFFAPFCLATAWLYLGTLQLHRRATRPRRRAPG